MFAADTSKRAINDGVDRASSSIELVGAMKADGVLATTLTNVETPGNWTPQTNVTRTTETSDVKQGSRSAKLTIGASFGTGLVAYEDLGSPVDLSAHYAAGLWIKADTTVADSVFKLVLDNNACCATPTETLNIPALVANTWKQVHMNVAAALAPASVACVAIKTTIDPGAVVLWIDQIQGPDEVQTVYLEMNNSLPTAGVVFVPATDTDSDGLLSDETSQTNGIVVTYTDPDKLIRTWPGPPPSWAERTGMSGWRPGKRSCSRSSCAASTPCRRTAPG